MLQPEPKNKLQLEVVRGGAGAGRRTAVGLNYEEHNEPDLPLLPAPIWFNAVLPFARAEFRQLLHELSAAEKLVLLRKAKLCRRYRVLLSQKWRIDLHESLTAEDSRKLLDSAKLAKDFSSFSKRFEQSAIWHFWRYWTN